MTTTALANDPGPFFSQSGAPLAILSRKGVVLRANNAFAEAFSNGDPAGRELAQLVIGPDRNRVLDALKAASTGEQPTFEATPERAGGGKLPRKMRVHPTLLDGGEVLISALPAPPARPDDEMRLAVFDQILTSGPVAYFAMDANGVYTSNEGNAGERMGVKPGGVVGKNALEMWKGTEAHGYIERSLAGEEVHTIASIPGVDTELWYLPVRGPDGRPNGAVGFIIDQTPQREAERALREKLALIERQNSTLGLLANVLSSAPLILWSTDETPIVLASEGKGLALLGMESVSVVGVNALDMYRDVPEIGGAIVKALGGEETRVMTTPIPGVHFDNWIIPSRGQDGQVTGVIGLAIDATDRVRSERELREKLDLIERQSATIRALATPIIKVWDEVLCLPVIGTVDSARTAEMMQALMEAIVREQAQFAIVDLTGVEVVDTSTADHLIQLFRAAKVLGVEGVLCGIRPAVAQTVVTLGLDLGSVKTMRSLRDALRWCIRSRSEPQARAAMFAANNGHAVPPRSAS